MMHNLNGFISVKIETGNNDDANDAEAAKTRRRPKGKKMCSEVSLCSELRIRHSTPSAKFQLDLQLELCDVRNGTERHRKTLKL
ncbi:hypothetical protein ACLKA6_001728 [Drosophila palustris]